MSPAEQNSYARNQAEAAANQACGQAVPQQLGQYAQTGAVDVPNPRIRELHITPVLNGWLVQCGCKTIVFTNLTTLTQEIHNYYSDPNTVSKRYLKEAVNKV